MRRRRTSSPAFLGSAVGEVYQVEGFGGWGLGFEVEGLGFRVLALGFRVTLKPEP